MLSQKRVSSFVSIIRVLALRGLGVLMSLFTASGLAYFFGAGPLLDAFFFVRRTFGSLTILVESLLTLLLVPNYVKTARETTPRDHLRRVGGLELRCFVFGLLMAVLAIFFAKYLVTYLAPGISAEAAEAAVFYFILMSLTLPITISTSVTAASLSAIRQFSLPVAVRLVPRLLILLAILLIPLGMGMTGIVLAAVVGHFMMGLVLWFSKRRLIRTLPDTQDQALTEKIESQQEPPERAGSFIVLGAYSLIVVLSESYFASFVGIGAIAILGLGQRLSTMGTSELLGSLLSVYYTNFSEAADNPSVFRAEMRAALRTGFFFITPLSLLLITLGDQVTQVVLANGAFTSAAAKSASALIALFAIAGVLNTFTSVFETALLALHSSQKTRNFFIGGCIALTLRIGFLFFFIGQLGLIAIGVAAIIGPIVFSFKNFFYVRKHVGNPVDRGMLRDFGVIACAGAVLAIVAVVAEAILPAEGGKLTQIMVLIVTAVMSVLAYVAAASAMGQDDAGKLTSKLLRRKREPKI